MHFPRQHHYINGAPSPSDSPADAFLTVNPATDTPLAEIDHASPNDLERAVDAAETAFKSWSKTTPLERSRILRNAVDILRSRNHDIATVESLDTGKPYSETSTVDIATGADVLEYYAGICLGATEGKTIRLRENAWIYTTKEPLGVCVGIGAWNYPIQIALWKSAPALAAGNTFIFKPSEVTPLTANILAQIYTEAGLPAGVFNVVHGDGKVGAWLSQCPRISKVSFTGQVTTGKKVYTTAASNLKPVTLELGGKSPLIIFPSADLPKAADCAMTANFFSTGQVCTNGTRVFVHESIKSEFEALLLDRITHGIRAGDPLDPDTNYGPVVSAAQWKKVREYIKHGIEVDKAKLLCGGLTPLPHLPKELKNGFFIPPTIFTSCTDTMKITTEEIFGPVMSLLPFTTTSSVLSRANKSLFGLAAGVFSTDLNIAMKVANELEAGVCWVNTWGESPAEMKVAGWKESGVGAENGSEGLDVFLKGKSVFVEGGEVGAVFPGSGAAAAARL